MPSYDDLVHERARFESMDERKLRTRLGRITKQDKLEAFIETAREFGLFALEDLARNRYRDLYRNVPRRYQPLREEERRARVITRGTTVHLHALDYVETLRSRRQAMNQHSEEVIRREAERREQEEKAKRRREKFANPTNLGSRRIRFRTGGVDNE